MRYLNVRKGVIVLQFFNFGSTIDLLKNAMQGSDMAHAAHANNIANANTPGFHRTEVSFKEALAQAAGVTPDDNQLNLATTDPSHIGAFGVPQAFQPDIDVDQSTQMRRDGNNVDIDQEMAMLSMNADYGQTGAQFLKNQYSNLRQAITE